MTILCASRRMLEQKRQTIIVRPQKKAANQLLDSKGESIGLNVVP